LPANATEDKNPLLMSVITPASEYNSTERVNAVTYKVLFEEIRRATEILLSRKDLSEVCKKADFFGSYPLFVEIDITGVNSCKDDEK
jgi:poly(A) polymerase Pap1